jgi:hypothetical protein
MSPRRPRNSSLVFKTAELGFAVPWVVAHRLARMAMAGPSPAARDCTEFRRMGVEKTVAFTESWIAMAMEAIRVHRTLTASFWRSAWSPWPGTVPFSAATLQDAALGVLGKGLVPIHRRAVANARRFARTR